MIQVGTEIIAASLMGWLRFGKQYHYVAREAGMYSCDVLGANTKNVIEVEIKVTRSDFKADWKKYKHQDYKKRKHSHTHTYPSGHQSKWKQHIPNQFYFACPEHMKDFAIEQVKEHGPEYGVIILRDNVTEIPNYLMWQGLKVVKKATFMHRKPPEPGLLTDIAARMSSDLAHIHFQRQMEKSWLQQSIQNSRMFTEALDIEKRQVKLKQGKER